MNYYDLTIALSLFIFAAWIWRYKIKQGSEKSALYNWLEDQPDKNQLKKILSLLDTIYKNANPKQTSLIDRKRLRTDADQFIYGEIDFLSFLLILKMAQPRDGEIFYDLGCGAGKAVMTAALAYDLASSVGIEYLPSLCKLANQKLDQAIGLLKQHKNNNTSYLSRLSNVQFINNDIMAHDFLDADIIFVNATCFPYYMWENLKERFQHLKPGARIIVTTKKISDQNFKLSYQGTQLMGWGMNSVNIYKKEY